MKIKEFTLIELCVVITIALIVMAMFPTMIVNAKNISKQELCRDNLYNIGKLTTQYLAENNDIIFPSNFSVKNDSKEYSWIAYLADKYNNNNIFKCPSLKNNECFKPHGSTHFEKPVENASYLMNTIHNWKGANIANPKKTFGWGMNAEEGFSVKNIANPSDKIFVVDATKNLSSVDAKGIVSFDETDHGYLKSEIKTGKRDVGKHHRNGFNSLMGDMSVKGIKKSKIEQWIIIND